MPATMPIRKPPFVPLARLYQTMAYVLCMIAMVGTPWTAERQYVADVRHLKFL
jgi:hypothetical protein